MAFNFNNSDKAKYASAKYALNFIDDGMKIGLGTGSTATWFVALLADLIQKTDIKVLTTSTSNQTRSLAESLGISVLALDDIKKLDLTIDGADEFDDRLNLIKGGGGALLQEKIVASSSTEMIVIADETKEVQTLGKFPLPIEVIPFGVETIEQNLSELFLSYGYDEAKGVIRKNSNKIFVTDEGHNILDFKLGKINNIEELSININNLPGVVEHGIFTNLCNKVLVGRYDGVIFEYTGKTKNILSQEINYDEMVLLKTLMDGK